jgi:hypothetical protein
VLNKFSAKVMDIGMYMYVMWRGPIIVYVYAQGVLEYSRYANSKTKTDAADAAKAARRSCCVKVGRAVWRAITY